MSKKNKENNNSKHRENFIPSSFSWLTPNEQKEKAKELENITKKRRGRRP